MRMAKVMMMATWVEKAPKVMTRHAAASRMGKCATGEERADGGTTQQEKIAREGTGGNVAKHTTIPGKGHTLTED